MDTFKYISEQEPTIKKKLPSFGKLAKPAALVVTRQLDGCRDAWAGEAAVSTNGERRRTTPVTTTRRPYNGALLGDLSPQREGQASGGKRLRPGQAELVRAGWLTINGHSHETVGVSWLACC